MAELARPAIDLLLVEDAALALRPLDSPTPRTPLDRVCQAFFQISITLFASSSESTAA